MGNDQNSRLHWSNLLKYFCFHYYGEKIYFNYMDMLLKHLNNPILKQLFCCPKGCWSALSGIQIEVNRWELMFLICNSPILGRIPGTHDSFSLFYTPFSSISGRISFLHSWDFLYWFANLIYQIKTCLKVYLLFLKGKYSLKRWQC